LPGSVRRRISEITTLLSWSPSPFRMQASKTSAFRVASGRCCPSLWACVGNVDPDEAMARIWPYLGALLIGVIVIAAVPWISIGFL
jgi:hypothetical protein